MLYVAIAIYVRTIFFDYVYDDSALIIINPWMASWKFVPAMFTHSFWASHEIPRQFDFYRPLVMVMLAVIFHVLGAAPGWFHLIAASLHVVGIYLVYRLVSEVTNDGMIAAITAGIFGLHPTKVETAAWISGISDSLSFVFFLGAMIWYFKWRKSRSNAPKFLFIGAGLLLLALFSKEAAIFAPLLIGIYEFNTTSGSLPKRILATVRASWPFAAVTLLALGIRMIFLHDGTHIASRIPLIPSLLTAPQAILWYLEKQIWPVRLSVQYPIMLVRHVSLTSFVLPLFLISVLTAGALRAVRKSATGIFFFSWFVLMLAPVIVYVIGLQEHDRYFYFASVATSLGLAQLVGALRRFPVAQATVVFGLFTALTISTFAYEAYWDNDEVLFTRAIQIAPDNFNAASYLAFFYTESHRFDDAEKIANNLVTSAGQSPESWYILGNVRLAEEHYAEAREALQKAVELGRAHNVRLDTALADTDLKLGRNEEAARIYQEELRRYPNVSAFHRNLAIALKNMNKRDEAARELEISKRLQ